MPNEFTAFLRTHQTRLAALSPCWVDGGAYKGEFIDACLDLWPDLRLDAFEPQQYRASKLQKKYRALDHVRVHAVAIGDCHALTTFYVTAANTLSSTLAPLPRFGGQREAALVETTLVEQVCLEQVLESPPGLVKLDIQGAELAAIKGLGKLLCGTEALLVERSTIRRYQGQPSDDALHRFLTSEGFRLEDTMPHARQEDGVLYDALYFRNSLL